MSAKEVVKMMLDHMTNPQTSTHLDLKKGKDDTLKFYQYSILNHNKFKYTDLIHNTCTCWFKGDRVACMINNLGGTSVLEMSIIAKEAIQQLGKEQCDVKSETFQCF